LNEKEEKQMDNGKSQTRTRRIARHIPSSSRERSALQLQRLLSNSRKVQLLVPVLRHVFTRSNAVDRHLGVEFKSAEELGGDEEVLAAAAAVFTGSGAGDVD
jgi:hypothetical protein